MVNLPNVDAFLNGGNKYQSDEPWEQMLPLPAKESSAPSLSSDMIPEVLRPWVCDIAERMQVALEFVMAPIIVMISILIGRRFGICPKAFDSWLVIPNLWGLIVGRPGHLKSPTNAEAMKPLDRLVAEAHEEFEAKKQSVAARLQALHAQLEGKKQQIKQASKKGEDREKMLQLEYEIEQLLREIQEADIHEQRYKTNDATTEKVVMLLEHRREGILVMRDELYGWMKILEKQGREGDREFYLESWDGYKSHNVDRVSRPSIYIPALCLSVYGGIQPGKLRSYVQDAVAGGAADDGLLQRFQIAVYPDDQSDWKNIDRPPHASARDRAFRTIEALDTFDYKKISLSGEDGVPYTRFSPAAQELFDDWRCHLEKRLRSGEIGCPAFESHLAKYRSLMPSLALQFHLLDKISGNDGDEFVSLESAALAADWCDFLELHAKKIYAAASNPELLAAHALAAKIKAKEVKDGMSVREIYRHHWSLLDTADKLEPALIILEQCRWLRVTSIVSSIGGRPSEVIKLHPDLIGG